MPNNNSKNIHAEINPAKYIEYKVDFDCDQEAKSIMLRFL